MTKKEDVIKKLPITSSSKVLRISWGKNKLPFLDFGNNTSINFDLNNGRKLPVVDGTIDFIILDRILSKVIYRESFIKECSRIICDGGVVLLFENKHDAFGMDNNNDSRVALDDALEYFDQADFLVGEKFDVSENEYGIIAVRPAN